MKDAGPTAAHSAAHLQLELARSRLDERSRELDLAHRRLDAVTQELEAARREADVARRELEEFASSVAHDLRSPLRSIAGFSSLLQSEHAGALDEDGRTYLQTIQANASRMDQLIDDLLGLSRVSRAPLRHAVVDLTRLAHDIVAALRARTPERRVRVSIQDGLCVQGDRCLLRTALENLLGNAWKYSRGREVAHLELAAEQHDGIAVFVVRDDGIGFDPLHCDKLFRPFHRLHGAREFEGNGAGLATVDRVLRRHGGRIWAEARPGAGAAFYFTLPAAVQGPQVPPPHGARTGLHAEPARSSAPA